MTLVVLRVNTSAHYTPTVVGASRLKVDCEIKPYPANVENKVSS